jgi:ribonuclease P protein component
MLNFRYRFHGHGSLRYVYMHGQTVRSRLMSIKYSAHPKRKDPRIAVVISKKVIKSAVGRNRVRRRLYEIMRHELPMLKENNDVVLIVFSAEVYSLPSDELVGSVKELLKEADIYKN